MQLRSDPMIDYLTDLDVLLVLRIALCVRCMAITEPVAHMSLYCILCRGSYIYVGGVDVFVFTIHPSRDGLQNNTMIII